jgi:putative two-component system response regulator
MKTHTTLGLQAIERAEASLEGEDAFLRYAKEIAHSHQEKWDGSGYPLGLAGDAIPVSARLMALADVYDALISARVYKPAFSHEEACRIIGEGRALHFDPGVCDAFVANAQRFAEIAAALRDEPA